MRKKREIYRGLHGGFARRTQGCGAADATHGRQPGLQPGRARGVRGHQFQPVRRRSLAGDRAQWRRQILTLARDRGPGAVGGRPPHPRGRRRRGQHRRTGALPRPPGRGEAVAVGARKPGVLDALSRHGGGTIESALEAVDLAPLAGLPAAYLSAGQRRRLSIARLVAVKRPTLAARRADLGARCAVASNGWPI